MADDEHTYAQFDEQVKKLDEAVMAVHNAAETERADESDLDDDALTEMQSALWLLGDADADLQDAVSEHCHAIRRKEADSGNR